MCRVVVRSLFSKHKVTILTRVTETGKEVKFFLSAQVEFCLVSAKSKNTIVVVARDETLQQLHKKKHRLDTILPPQDMMQMFSRIVQHRLFGSAWLVSKKQKIDNTWSTQESRRTKRGYL